MRGTVKILLLILLALGLLSGAFVWRLAQGPISLAPVQGILETLIARGSPFVIDFSAPVLAWSIERETLELAARDIEVRTTAGEFVMSAPYASASVDAEALVRERALIPVEVEIRLPELTLTRVAPRHFELSFAGKLATLPLERLADSGVLANMGGGRPETGDRRLERLRLVGIEAPVLHLVDAVSGRNLSAGAAELAIARHPRGWRASLGAGLFSKNEQGAFKISAEPGGTANQQQVELLFSGIPAAILPDVLPSLPKGDVSGRLGGRVTFSLDTARLEPGEAALELLASKLGLTMPGTLAEPVMVEAVRIGGKLAPGWRAAAIDEATLASGGLELRAHGDLALVEGTLRGTADIEAVGLDIGQVVRFWPLTEAGNARQWVAERIRAGSIAHASIKAELPLDAAKREAWTVETGFDFADATVHYLKTMPPASEVRGRARLTRKELEVVLAGGRVDEVTADAGRITIRGFGPPEAPPPLLTVDLPLRGPLRSAMTTLNAEPLRLAAKMEIDPAGIGGRGEAALRLELPIQREIKPNDVRFEVEADLVEAGIEKILRKYRLDQGILRLTVDNDAADVVGQVAVNGVPAQTRWHENLREGVEPRRQVEVQSTIDAAAARSLEVPWPAFLSRTLRLDATLRQPRRGARQVDVRLDLADAAVDLDRLGIGKTSGMPGQVTGTITLPPDKSFTLDRIEIRFPGADITGRIIGTAEPFAWQRITLNQVALGNSRLMLDLQQQRGRITGTLGASRLDLRAWRQGMTAGDGDAIDMPPLALQVGAAEVYLADTPMRDVAGQIERNGDGWGTIRLGGKLADGSDVSLDHAVANGGGTVEVRAENGGGFLQALGVGETRIEGGRLRLAGTITGASPNRTITGELRLREFRLANSPIIARIFTLASFSGLTSALTGQGIPVDRLTIPFIKQGDRIELKEARLVGAEIGARAEGVINLQDRTIDLNGTIAPAYTLNRILGRIPIVGQILRGENADAALAATFSVKGSLSNPGIMVNPLAALVPGIIRDLFRDFGTSEPGERQEDRQ